MNVVAKGHEVSSYFELGGPVLGSISFVEKNGEKIVEMYSNTR